MNPSGFGNDVTNGVDFIPWASTPCRPLQAGFTAVPISGPAPLEVTFSNTSTGVYTTSLWDFGDGTTSTEHHPTHTYSTVGSYTVTLTVSDLNEESSLTRTDFITVHDAVEADFTADLTEGIESLTVTFTNLSTGDFDNCLWNFGDGHTTNSCGNSNHNYMSPGDYTVSLTVSGPGGTDTETKNDFIMVYQLPQAGFTANATNGQVPLTVSFTNSSIGDYDSCIWDFGDGGTSNLCGNTTHTYLIEGTFTVVLTITGPGGSSTETREAYIMVTPSKSIYLPLALK
jgi:PKD repeat protein